MAHTNDTFGDAVTVTTSLTKFVMTHTAAGNDSAKRRATQLGSLHLRILGICFPSVPIVPYRTVVPLGVSL